MTSTRYFLMRAVMIIILFVSASITSSNACLLKDLHRVTSTVCNPLFCREMSGDFDQ